jgi:hypothetical protein
MMSSLGPDPATSGASGSAVRSQRRFFTSTQIAAGFFVVFLAIQLAVPIVQLVWAPRPARFGWQMYSVTSAAPRFDLVLRDGTSQPVAIEPYVASVRGDVPLARFLPRHLCGLFPHAAAVRYHLVDGSSGVYQCGA